MGRPKKFELGDIVEYIGSLQANGVFVVVGYESIDDTRRYRVIPLDFRMRRRGDAVWKWSWILRATGQRSGTASVKTYRANEALIERGCSCQCCIHTAFGSSEWTNWGRWRDPEPVGIEDPEILGLTP